MNEPSNDTEVAALKAQLAAQRREIDRLERELRGQRDEPSLEALWLRIETRMGLCPAFFKLARGEPRVAHLLYEFAEAAYLDNPLPPLLKETLFTYLSRFCDVRYCVARHAGFLLGSGHVAGDPAIPAMTAAEVSAMLSEPYPVEAERQEILSTLEASRPLEDWPDQDTPAARRMRIACAMVFLEGAGADAWLAALRRLLGESRYEHLMLFLAFVRAAHYWTEVHPDLHWEEDLHALMREHPQLAEVLLKRPPDVPPPGEPTSVRSDGNELDEVLALMNSLRASEDRWMLALEAADAGAWELDLHDNTAWHSLRHDQIFGYERLLPSWTYERFLEHVVPEHRATVRDSFDRALRDREDLRFECRIERADGVMRWIRATARAGYDGAGRPLVMRGIVEDITARKRRDDALRNARAAARERAQLFRSVIDASPFPKIIHAEDGEIIMMNPAWEQLSGYRHKEIPTIEAWTQRAYGERTPDVGARHVAAEAVADEMVPQGEFLVRTAAGEMRTWDFFYGSLGRDDQGRRLVLSTAADVTEKKQAEETLREADRAKDEFLAVLGHELRNPLAPLRTGLDLLAQAPRNPQLIDTLRPMMDRQLSHLVRLVDDLLDISRVSQGRISLQRDHLDLRAPVTAAVEQVKPLIVERDHDLVLELDEGPLPVHGDFERLTQVVANLLSNAAKYTEPGGTIIVRGTVDLSPEGNVVLTVRDTGYGIPRDRLGKLFKLFSQIPEHQSKTGGGGLGIGLALSRQLIHMHGGSIGALSEGLDRGTTFTVRLPVDAGRPDVHAAEDAPAGPGIARRVLVVDDRMDAANALRLLLEHSGHQAEAVNDGPAALARMAPFAPHAVLLDLGLPGMDGLEVARRIRALPAGEDVLLVAVTGWGQEEDRARTTAATFDAHLTKPVDSQGLLALINR